VYDTGTVRLRGSHAKIERQLHTSPCQHSTIMTMIEGEKREENGEGKGKVPGTAQSPHQTQ